MEGEDMTQSISERRVRLYHAREGAARTIGSLLSATGAVEALSENSSVQGILSVIVGLALERDAKDPSWLTTIMVLPAVTPSVLRMFRGTSKVPVSAIEAFVTALKCACLYMALRLLFMTRRLRQLGDLQTPKDVE